MSRLQQLKNDGDENRPRTADVLSVMAGTVRCVNVPEGGGSSGSFRAIPDLYNELDDVREAMDQAGIKSCGLMFAIDYTMSNRMQGRKTFNNKCLHDLESGLNPYQQVICVLGDTLESRIHGGVIPAYGFGDQRTTDKAVFPLKKTYCKGFMDVLETYEAVTPTINLAGPTNFAPIISEAVNVLKEQKCYYILVIVADGQVTSKKATVEALVEASKYPLSIVVIGVGDGPWNGMKEFDDELPEREFDNFQFVNFHEVMSNSTEPLADLARNALMEVPEQYKQIKDKGYLNFQ